MIHDTVIEVFTTKVRVSIRRNDFENAIVDVENGHVKGSSSQIIHKDVLLSLLVQSIRDGGGRGFVQDTFDTETGDGTSVLGGLKKVSTLARKGGKEAGTLR